MRSWSWLYQTNLLALLGATLGLYLAVSHLAYVTGRKARRRAPRDAADVSAFVTSTIFGLLALILGFSFSTAASLYERRWQLVVSETNAISTTFLRSRLLGSISHREFEERLRAYLDARIEAYDVPFPSERARIVQERVSRLQTQLWTDAILATRTDRDPVDALFIATLNEMFDLQNERECALSRTMPETIYFFIVLISAMALGTYSYGSGYNGEPGPWKPVVLALMLALVFGLINDLDRPRRGIIRVRQDAMIDLRRTMDQP